ncbi:MAG: hypothetical protein U5R06_02350 [candidate division KSB1 bacterium]|nr:hypothetical protein [candidate division KSB1 bacterium]
MRSLVSLESPFARNIPVNTAYARLCIKDSLNRGESPIAGHLLYTQPFILNDTIPHERKIEIDAHLAWLSVADRSVVYMDRGISQGMRYAIDKAQSYTVTVEYRTLPGIDSLYYYPWGNNSKRKELKGRIFKLLSRGDKNSALVEFLDNGQREIISRNAIRKLKTNPQR